MASTMQQGSDESPVRDRPSWRDLGIGALAGLVAGLVLTLAQLLARLWVEVAPPSELIGDRIAPLLPVQQFLQLLGFFGRYDQLKQVGIVGPTLGQLTLAVVLGPRPSVSLRCCCVAWTATPTRSRSRRRWSRPRWWPTR